MLHKGWSKIKWIPLTAPYSQPMTWLRDWRNAWFLAWIELSKRLEWDISRPRASNLDHFVSWMESTADSDDPHDERALRTATLLVEFYTRVVQIMTDKNTNAAQACSDVAELFTELRELEE